MALGLYVGIFCWASCVRVGLSDGVRCAYSCFVCALVLLAIVGVVFDAFCVIVVRSVLVWFLFEFLLHDCW